MTNLTFPRFQEYADIFSILKFRQSIPMLDSPFPFGFEFGSVESRLECIAKVEALYLFLVQNTPERNILVFDTLALIALRRDGSLDEEKVKELIHEFRPDRNGNLSLLDFAKSVDSVYKDLRLLRASIANNSRMDGAVETVINVIFYAVIGVIFLGILGLPPKVLFIPLAALVPFTFMLGSACSSYFEVRSP